MRIGIGDSIKMFVNLDNENKIHRNEEDYKHSNGHMETYPVLEWFMHEWNNFTHAWKLLIDTCTNFRNYASVYYIVIQVH